MILKDFPPDAVLSDIILCYRIVHFELYENKDMFYKAYPPKPEESLLFYLHEGEVIEMAEQKKIDLHVPVGFLGQQTFLIKRYPKADFLTIQIVFQPSAVYRLTGVPSNELTNQYIDAENIFPKELIRFIHTSLQQSGSYFEMVQRAKAHTLQLVAHIRKDKHPLDTVIHQIIQPGHTLDDMARESFLSTKQFERKFFERVGTHPKTYSLIVRMNHAFNLKNAYPDRDWLEIALECGYYDHQHLAKSYKQLTGFSPKQLHELEKKSPESLLRLTKELYEDRARSISVFL